MCTYLALTIYPHVCPNCIVCMMAYSQVSPLKTGKRVEHEGKVYKIINHEKPNPNFARQYIIQSFEDGLIKKVFRHQIFEIDENQQSRPSLEKSTSKTSTTTSTNGELFRNLTYTTIFNEQSSKSDTESLDLNVDQFDLEPLSQSDTELLEVDLDEPNLTQPEPTKPVQHKSSNPVSGNRFKTAPTKEKLDTIANARN